ncbi:MAG: hypothetical protein FGM57_00160 [Candidatus Taylorbacteria bacterium]|nr:hypothetical protein [Candidatus Taylorbacteria bacterium]
MSSEFKFEEKAGSISPKSSVESNPDQNIQLYISKAITDLKDSQTANFITILGIFASFLAFLIIEIQILKTVCDYLRIMGFSLFILGAIFCFITFLLYFIDSTGKKLWHIVLLSILSLVLIGGGIYSISKGEDEYVCKLNRLDTDFQKLQQNLQDKNDKWLIESTKDLNNFKASLRQNK